MPASSKFVCHCIDYLLDCLILKVFRIGSSWIVSVIRGLVVTALFVALSVMQRQSDTLWSKLMERIKSPRTEYTIFHLQEASFGVIIAEENSRGLDWQAICNFAGRYKNRMLLPASLQIPNPVPLCRFLPQKFDRDILTRTACKLLSLSNISLYRRIVGIIDLEGRYAGVCEGLLRYCTTLKIFTKNQPYYEAFAENMMDTIGAPVIISDRMDCLKDCVLIVCPESFSGVDTVLLPGPVLTGRGVQLWRTNLVLTNPRILLTDEQRSCLPPGIDEMNFLAALYELGGWKSQLTADFLELNGKQISLDQAGQLILSCGKKIFSRQTICSPSN